MGYPRIPDNPNKPQCTITTQTGEWWCITCAVSAALRRAGQHDRAVEWMDRIRRQHLNRKRRLLLAHKYVDIR